jgi:hypothetical protein
VRKPLIAGATAALLALGAVGPASAQEPITNVIENVQVEPVTIDTQTKLPSVTVTWDCVGTWSLVRVRLTLTQRNATSQQTSEGAGGCVAGETRSDTLVFGFQSGTFRPGPASYQGFVTTLAQPGGDDVASIPLTATRIITH